MLLYSIALSNDTKLTLKKNGTYVIITKSHGCKCTACDKLLNTKLITDYMSICIYGL